MSFDLGDYVDVAERIQVFKAEYPDGVLQGEGDFVRDETGAIIGYLYRAFAYRNDADPRPGIGHAYEPIPGKTPYTRDSEVMNAETSAWGRAIVALGFETKKIASRQEVQNRQNGSSEPDAAEGTTTASASGSEKPQPADGGDPAKVEFTFGKHKGKTVAEVPEEYKKWLVENFEPHTPEQRRILAAVKEDLSIPF